MLSEVKEAIKCGENALDTAKKAIKKKSLRFTTIKSYFSTRTIFKKINAQSFKAIRRQGVYQSI